MEGTQLDLAIVLLSESTICCRDSGEVKFGIIQFYAHLPRIYEHRLSPLILLSC